MSYKIVVDSCGELHEELKRDSRFESVPLEIEVGEDRICDDETFDQASFLKKLADCPTCPKSSCPSPARYMESFEADVDRIYVVTLSSNLSGSYNSAVLAKEMYEEENGNTKEICVIDSRSASCGETQLVMKAAELEEEGLSFQEIVRSLEEYRDSMDTFFVLDNLDTLRKNGRLTGIKSVLATTLSIKPVMGSTDEGTIIQLGQCVGLKKSMTKMAELAAEKIQRTHQKVLYISHCNNEKMAEYVRQVVEKKIPDVRTHILNTAGISSMYANEGGVIVAV